jgi:gliding motility-associated-like protein
MLDPTFNGIENSSILIADSSSLAIGASDTFSFIVKVLNKKNSARTYSNSITGSALDGTTVVTDASQSGLIPDANNDNNPGNDSEPTVFSVNGARVIDSTLVVIIPDAISPNGDNLNDKFVISNIRESDNVSVAIYNRWGQLVFLTDNYKREFPGDSDGWNGVANQGIAVDNSGVPAGTYFYCIISDNARLFEGKPLYNFITVAR